MQREILPHLYHCVQNTKQVLRGFDGVLEQIKSLLTHGLKNEHKLILIHGPEGSGKTAILSQINRMAMDTLGKETIFIVRYLGLDPTFCSSDAILRSVCTQLEFILKQTSELCSYDHSLLTQHFSALLKRISQEYRTIVIVFDGLEHIRITGKSNILQWITERLPAQVFIIASLSTTPSSDLLKTYESRLEGSVDNNSVIEIPKLSRENAKEIIDDHLDHQKRKLDCEQEQSLLGSIMRDPRPLCAVLACEKAMSWTSQVGQFIIRAGHITSATALIHLYFIIFCFHFIYFNPSAAGG